MLQLYVSAVLIMISIVSNAQIAERSSDNNGIPVSLTQETGDKLKIGGYGEVHFNKPLNSKTISNAELDVHRMVLLMEYGFNARTRFVTEIEFEHVIEVYVEQAYLQHKINKYMQFRAGLLLVPMGIINGTHEPTSFNGVERPLIDQKISPTTWREVGLGFSGTIDKIYTRYQIYTVNGFSGYDTKGVFTGAQPLREGRQKGSKSYITSPNYTAKLEYYGINKLTIGVSGYFGKSQSKLYQGLHSDSSNMRKKADSSVLGISMLGADLRYNLNGIKVTAQFYYTALSNTQQYNTFTAIAEKPNDVGSALMGYYAEIGYNVFKSFTAVKYELMPFFRYEFYDTHYKVNSSLIKNELYNNAIITTGLTLTLTKGAVIKTDLQFIKNSAATEYLKVFNAGVGVMF